MNIQPHVAVKFSFSPLIWPEAAPYSHLAGNRLTGQGSWSQPEWGFVLGVVIGLLGLGLVYVIGRRLIAAHQKAAQLAQIDQERFEAIANFTYDWESWLGPHGQLLWANPMVEHHTGYSVESCMAMPDYPLSFVHEADRDKLHNLLQQALQEQVSGNDFEFRIIRQDSHAEVWMAISWQPVYTSQGEYEGVRFSAREITRRKEAEITLNQYKQIVSATADSMSLVDNYYVYRVVNIAYLKRTGKTYDEIVGHTVAEVMGERTFQELIKEKLDRCLQGEAVQYQTWFEFPAGEGRCFLDVSYTPYFDDSSQAIYCLVSARNITPLKTTEESLRQSEERYRTLFENMAQGAFYQQADGQLIEVNNAALEMFGLAREEFLGKTSYAPNWQVIYEDGSPMPAAEHPSMVALRSGKPVRNVRAGVFNPRHNDYVWMNINAIPQFLPGETQPFQVFVTLHDFTKRKHIEKQLEASLKEKEVLLKELHHRTKNNMYVISAMLALQAGNTKDQQAQKVFRDVQNRIQAMALTHQKLYQSKNLSSIDLADYIQDLARWLVQSYRVGANQISLNFELEPVSILIDAAVPCGLILNELIANALEHAFPDHCPGEITIRLYRNQDAEITMEVQDNGIGLPPDFNFSSPASFGLQVVKNIAEHQLQGQLIFEYGSGVKWRVSFKDNLYQTRV